MTKFHQISLLLFIPALLTGQNFQSQFRDCYTNKDTACEKEVLTQWENAHPDDPELYTSYFNYHFVKARRRNSPDSKWKN